MAVWPSYAVDLADYDAEIVSQVKSIAALFDAKLSIVHVNEVVEETEKVQYRESLEQVIAATLDDLVYQDLEWGQKQLKKRGFQIVSSDAAKGKQFWYKQSNKHCVVVKISGNKISEISDADKDKCKHKEHQSQEAAKNASHDKTIHPDQLVGVKGSSMENQLQSNGFTNTGGYKDDGASHTTWWNASTKQCFTVKVKDGRVKKAENIPDGNCL